VNIVVNTRLLIKDKLEGIGWFAYETLKRITTNHPEHHFTFLFDRPFSEEFIFSDNITPKVVSPPTRHPLLWYLWFEYAIPPVLNKEKADLFFSPDGWLSLRAKTKSVNVIHDLNFHHYPQFIPFHVRSYYYYYFPRFARKAERIATVSEFSKNDISTRYGINPDLIDVVYNGANESYKPLTDSEKIQIKKQYSQNEEYFMFVGLIHPRKNLAHLFTAFDLFKKQTGSPFKLVIVGEKKWWTVDIKSAFNAMLHQNDVIFTGRLATEELKKVIGAAFAMTYVPYFEGFGIPILEAMFCDTPVITSNTSSMPEVGGDAVLLADPFSSESICEAMVKLVKDNSLRQNLIEKGRKRRLDFSWDKTSERLWGTIEKCL